MMNYKQRRVCWIALGLFGLSLLAVPCVNWGSKTLQPFWNIKNLSYVRINILTDEWIGIGVITFLLCIFLKSSSSNNNQPSAKQDVKKLLKILVCFLAIGLLLGLVLYGVDNYNQHLERNYIKSSELSFSGVELVSENIEPLDPQNPFSDIPVKSKSFILRGSVTNNSKEYTVKFLGVRVLMLDNLANGRIEKMAFKDTSICGPYGGYNGKLPPGQSKNFKETLYFKDFPHPYGKVTWTYQITEIDGEKDNLVYKTGDVRPFQFTR